MPSRPGNIQSRMTKSKLSRLSRKKPSSPVFAVIGSKPSLRNPLARARAVLASSSINKTLTSQERKIVASPRQDGHSEENFRRANTPPGHSVHRSIFHKLPVVEDAVSEELAA